LTKKGIMIYPKSILLTPRRGAKGVVALPGSKSISNRMLLLAALAQGRTTLHNLLDSEDTQVMVQALQTLGVSVQGGCIEGVGGIFPNVGSAASPLKIFVGNSGLTIRTLVPALVASFSKTGGCVELYGVPRMHERPIGDLVDGLRAIGAEIDYLSAQGFPPLRIRGASLAPVNEIRIKGTTSSQFLTGLMQAAPVLATQWNHAVALSVEGELISKPYIEITRAVLKKFGVDVQAIQTTESARQRDGLITHRFVINPQTISAAGDLHVEGDASSASYFLAAGMIGGGPVRVTGVGKDSVQGDIRFADALERMGATIDWGPDWIEARARHCEEPLRGDVAIQGDGSPQPPTGLREEIAAIDIDCNHIPDAAMTLVACALFANGPTQLRGIGSWKVKETDRILAMANECKKLGVTAEYGDDWIRIHPAPQLRPATIETYEDHRVAMAFSLVSFGNAPVRIDNPGCVAKTFPNYFEVFSDLCAQAVPVLAIDGPTASGKGTIASLVAMNLGFGYLDSGALYRITALAAQQSGVDDKDEQALASIATDMELEFLGQTILLDGVNISHAIRAEEVGVLASKIAVFPAVRSALLLRQRDFARLPGLVADGRDMGTVVFPNAQLKIFLTATARARAQRRYKQLIDKGFSANLDSLSADLEARDARDASRAVAPLKPAPGAVVVDSTDLSIDEVVQAVIREWRSAVYESSSF
jgi:3-phosphoshikimate 1-carboxyvinyltransferase